jgi:hypothetical protein
MSFLRRLLGGGDDRGDDRGDEGNGTNGAGPPIDAVDAGEAERLHERELLRSENERLDELRLRQLKYADKAWTPPAQGGERRADDAEGAADR